MTTCSINEPPLDWSSKGNLNSKLKMENLQMKKFNRIEWLLILMILIDVIDMAFKLYGKFF